MRELEEFGFGSDPADERTQRLPPVDDADVDGAAPRRSAYSYEERSRPTSPGSDLVVRKLQQIVNYIFGVIATILGLRFLLVAIGANPDNPFFVLLRELSDPLVAPFANIVVTPRLFGATIETTTIFAIIIYILARQALVRFLDLFVMGEEDRR